MRGCTTRCLTGVCETPCASMEDYRDADQCDEDEVVECEYCGTEGDEDDCCEDREADTAYGAELAAKRAARLRAYDVSRREALAEDERERVRKGE